MTRTTRTAAGAMALAVALGAGTPLAAAAAPDKAGHVKVAKSDRAQKEKADKGKQSGQEKKAAQELRQLLRDLEKTDGRLAKAAREARLAALGDHAAVVLANVTADRAALGELAVAAQAADSGLDLRQVRRELRDVREQNYNKVVNDLRHAMELAAQLDAARLALAADPAAPVADLDAAQLALDEAVAKALLINASSDKAALHAVKVDLQAAEAALEAVAAYLDGLVVEEPVVEEPVVEEPVVEEPVVEEPVVEPAV